MFIITLFYIFTCDNISFLEVIGALIFEKLKQNQLCLRLAH